MKISLDSYIKNLKQELGTRVVGYLVKDDEVLLGQKKDGMGLGNFIGIGGKIEKGETEEQALIREMIEEIKIKPQEIEQRGTINFYFPHKEKWNHKILPFVCTKWSGVPTETSEIKPAWFQMEQLPFDQMWDDAHFWIPKMLSSQSIEAHFLYGKDNMVKEHTITFMD